MAGMKMLLLVMMALYAQARDLPVSQNNPTGLYGFEQVETHNIIHVPNGCPSGQKPDAAGVCRPVWFSARVPYNIITVPPNCPPGQKPDPNGHCREEWYNRIRSVDVFASEPFVQSYGGRAFVPGVTGERNIFQVPSACPRGYNMNSEGLCKKLF